MLTGDVSNEHAPHSDIPAPQTVANTVQERESTQYIPAPMDEIARLASRPPIAVILAGHMRSFRHRGVVSRLKQNLIDTISVGGAANVHLFLFLYKEDSAGFQSALDAAQVEFGASLVGITVLEDNHNDCNHPSIQKSLCCRPDCLRLSGYLRPHGLTGCLQYLALSNSLRFVQRYSTVKNVKYDWIVRARPDLAIVDSIGPLDAQNNSFQKNTVYHCEKEGGQAADYFLLIPFPVINQFIQASVDRTYEGCPTIYAPEYLIFKEMRRMGLRVEQRQFPLTIVRQYPQPAKPPEDADMNGVECSRMDFARPSLTSPGPQKTWGEMCKTLAQGGVFWT